jgi:site-specific recombinase XerD
MNIKGFLKNLATQTSSIETLRAYRQDLQRYEAFLRMKGLRATQAKSTTITDFIAHLTASHGSPLAPATVARRLAVLSEYYQFLGNDSNGKIKNPVQRVKRPTVNNDAPRAVEDHILAALVGGIRDKRDKAIVLMFLYTGLRLSELRQLDKTTIVMRKRVSADGSTQYFGTGEVLGKGRKRRQFLVGPTALEALREYIKEFRATDNNPALFLSQRRQRISSRAIQETVDKWCKKLDISHVHVHRLRHSYATRNVNAGMSAAVLQQLLGHSTLSATQRYFRVQPDRLSREYFSVMEYVRQCSPV